MTDDSQWPRYTHSLKSSLPYDANIVTELETRLKALCALLGVDRSHPMWERHLLATLLVRHVPGFLHRKTPTVENNDISLIELIDLIKDHYTETEGRRPTTEAVVVEIAADTDPDNPWSGKKPSRLERIYSGRSELLRELDDLPAKTKSDIRDLYAFWQVLGTQEDDSFAKLIHRAHLP